MKLKFLTILLIIAYLFSFNNHFKDMKRGFNEGYDSGSTTLTNPYYITIKNSTEYNAKLTTNHNSSKIIVTDSTSRIRVDDVPFSYSFLRTVMIMSSFIFVGFIIYGLYNSFIILKFLYKGETATRFQIKRIKILASILLGLAIYENLLEYLSTYEASRIASLYNLEAVKGNFNFTMFFIPLILLMIVEVLKQHLRLKEDAELTI
ncbi:DUF2975 domain-containing protein [Myroides odoratimimus]|uniref:DUF2975 domain-containing protein n=2 Tax=Myroides odoratimimus TaxID=76832 RepID=UPI00103D9AF3|nr:DUF2975 domain-containing protein [Myroides odoratimimus]MCA4791811.1 DUF2975 domain-containing protein [Myroides odoratimimus]MCA4805644.1 DUF2975 domain-containing protein [Myroides odoratimimus]MCA4819072.1 DUF2975 domain-containing protein [Myroides odoratimimus]MDM1059179.1 DUF2975 domain-containing protein [Myroides odoratimimus]MDM1091733.1 DUF2975 domain-containing protein [Myroides odoratimimus]